MRKLLILPALLGVLVLCLGGAAQANLLINGNLELPEIPPDATPTGWVLDEGPLPSTDTASLAEFGVNSNHTPDDGLGEPENQGLFLQPWRGGSPGNAPTVFAHLTQTVPHVPGMNKYIMTGWARFEVNYAGGADFLDADGMHGGDNLSDMDGAASPTDTEFAIEFLDGGGGILDDVVIELKANGQPNDNFGPNVTVEDATWHQHMLMGSAPLGTVSVRVRASMIDGVFNTDPEQSAFFDDFSLICIPEPGSVVLGLIGVLGLVGLTRRR